MRAACGGPFNAAAALAGRRPSRPPPQTAPCFFDLQRAGRRWHRGQARLCLVLGLGLIEQGPNNTLSPAKVVARLINAPRLRGAARPPSVRRVRAVRSVWRAAPPPP